MANQKRLAIAMPAFYEQVVGGAEYQAYLLADMARKRGHEVHYIFVSDRKEYENKLNLELHPIPAVKLIKKKILGPTWSFHYRRISSILNKIRPDIVYCRGGWSFAGMLARYAKNNECVSFWHVASSRDVMPPRFSSLFRRPLEFLERKAVEYAIRHSTRIIAHAGYQADLLKRYYGRSSEIIPKSQPQPEEELDKSGDFTVTWVANIKPLKRPHAFVHLAKRLTCKKGVKFLMVGRPSHGRYQSELESEIQGVPNLKYIGGQPVEKVNQILAKSHVFVNTSIYEGFPNTFIQSWMREVPVISMSVDPDDVLATKKLGFFSGSFERMVEDLCTLIDNRCLRDEMGRKAREYALEHHSIERNFGRLLALMGL